jgi:cytochrome c553
MRFQLALCIPVVLITLAANVASAADVPAGDAAPDPGQELFERHGCTNCHGADGIHPESKYVPILRGKSSDYLYRHASRIFDGEHASDKTVFMHDQFCSREWLEERGLALVLQTGQERDVLGFLNHCDF